MNYRENKKMRDNDGENREGGGEIQSAWEGLI